MTIILALDLGTKTGWALINNNHLYSGIECFKNDRYSGGGMRFLKFNHWLHHIKDLNNRIDEVYFEEVRRHAGTDAAHVYGGLMGVLTAWCEEQKIPYEGVPIGTIKKYICGKGNANKEEVIEAVKKKGYNPKDDNEADALALLCWRLDKK